MSNFQRRQDCELCKASGLVGVEVHPYYFNKKIGHRWFHRECEAEYRRLLNKAMERMNEQGLFEPVQIGERPDAAEQAEQKEPGGGKDRAGSAKESRGEGA